MIALLAPAVPHVDPRAMTPTARLAEVAQLLARAYLRARAAPTALPMANAAPDADSAPAAPGRIALALSREAEPACAGNTRARVSPAGRVPHQATGDEP